jgi:uncharacterized metal-binding protein
MVTHYAAQLKGIGITTAPWATTLLVTAAYLFSGLWLSNDLDIDSRIYRRWGPFRWLWYPYQRLMKHRSWLSHGVAVGPLLRLVYLYVMLELILRAAHRMARFFDLSTAAVETGLRMSADVWPYVLSHPHISLPLLAGLVLGGVAHSVVDVF